ncbi:hypothetical protein D3C81_1757540 [compost metagenome]
MDQHVLPGKGIGGDQPRQPEAHAGDAQGGRPELGFGGGERAQRGIGPEQRAGEVGVEAAVLV